MSSSAMPRRSARIAKLSKKSNPAVESSSEKAVVEAPIVEALVSLAAPSRMDEVEMDMDIYEDLLWDAQHATDVNQLHAMSAFFKFVSEHSYLLDFGSEEMIPDQWKLIRHFRILHEQNTEYFADALANSVRIQKYAYLNLCSDNVTKTLEYEMKLHNLYVSVSPYADKLAELLTNYSK